MKRIALITILLSVACSASVHAQATFNYTPSPKQAAPVMASPVDTFQRSVVRQPAPKVTDDSPGSSKPKETTYVSPTRAARSKTFKDDREVIVTRNAIVKQNLSVKTVPPTPLYATPNKVKSPFSPVQRGKSAVDHPTFSKVEHAPQ